MLPVVLVLSVYVEVVIVRVGFVAFPISQLNMQAVVLGAGQLVDNIIAQPVLPRGVPKALK